MSKTERQLRSELARLVNNLGLIRGSLATRERTCGKPSCRCVTRGEKHASLYLVVSEQGRYRQVYVPRAFEERVRRWVENRSKARELFEDLSNLHYEKLRKRES
jgi:hypothetical protein